MVVALIAAMALLLVPASASATSPVLEFVVPSSQAVHFNSRSGAVIAEMAGFDSIVHCAHSEGEGKITGPRSAVSRYNFTKCVTEGGTKVKCKSEGAQEEEITTGEIDAELVYIDQATHQVGILMNPSGGVYMSFKCGGEAVEAKGAFLAPVSPINQEVTSFTATLSHSGSMQAPDVYENENGELVPAIPMGNRPGHEFVPTSVAATMTIETSVPVEIKSVTTQDIETQQHEEEAKEQEATLKQLEEAVKKAEEHIKQVAEEAKKREEQLNTQVVEAKKREEQANAEAAEATRKLAEAEKAKSLPLTRAQLLTRALRRCKQQPKKRRARCVANAYKTYGKAKQKGQGASTGLAATRDWAKS